ncbi:MAG: GNAT family N-acetyltransferase [Alphaproteobacteria bacterium]|nr:GNAT family N-acetyltransferase [Alphaproteobacteria bacterium]
MIKYFTRNLRSERLVLKHLEPNKQNAKMIYDALKNENPDDYKYEPLMKMPKILPTSVADTLKMMQYHSESEKSDACVFYMFHDNQFIGVRKISFYKEANTLKLNTVWLVFAARKHGFATESYRVIEDVAFNKLKVNKIMRVNLVENKKSAKLAENTGLILDGISRQAVFMNGKYHDLMQWSKLYSDYMKEKNNQRK